MQTKKTNKQTKQNKTTTTNKLSPSKLKYSNIMLACLHNIQNFFHICKNENLFKYFLLKT